MNDNELIHAIRARAIDGRTRTDMSSMSPEPVSPPCHEDDIAEAERRLGFALYPLHRRLLEEVGNGGFGPGYGLFGVPGGHSDDQGRSMIELRDCLGRDTSHPRLPSGVLPLCDFGCAVWVCIDSCSDDGRVIVSDASGLTDSGMSFRAWLTAWVDGQNLAAEMFTLGEEHEVIDPFTRRRVKTRGAGRAKGVPYKGRD